MKRYLVVAGTLLLVGCSSPEVASTNPPQASSPTPSQSAVDSTQSPSLAPVLKVSDEATCQTVLGGDDNQVLVAAEFLGELGDFDAQAYDEAQDIVEGLDTVAQSASSEIATLLQTMQEPFQELIEAADNGTTQVEFRAERFKIAANELLSVCEPLIDDATSLQPISESAPSAEVDAPTSSEEVAEPLTTDAADDPADGTTSQMNALETAEDYLQYSAFSKKGLIRQLEFEKYSNSDAKWAAEHVSVDWNEQAAEMAKQYLDYSSFSRQGLIDQLVFEGFSPKQASYGVKEAGL